MGYAERQAKRDARGTKFNNWVADLFGIGEGIGLGGIGVADETGAYSGGFGRGPAGTGTGGAFDVTTPGLKDPGPPDLEPPDIGSIYDSANAQAEENMRGIRELLGSASEGTGLYGDIANLPTFTEWMEQQNLTSNDPYAEGGAGQKADALAALIAQLSPDSPEAQAYAASIAGFEDITNPDGTVTTAWEQRQDFVQGLTDIVGAGEGAGMSAEDMALQEKTIRRNTAEMEDRAARMIADSKSETGSMGRMFMQADESLNQIANIEIQQQAQLAADNRNLAFQQYQGALQGLDQQLQSGQISTTDYVDTKRMALGEAMAGYFKEVDNLFTQNEQYLSQYQADKDALIQQVQLSFAAIQMEMGINMQEYEEAATIALQALAPYYTAMELESLAKELRFNFDDVVNMISAAADIIGSLNL